MKVQLIQYVFLILLITFVSCEPENTCPEGSVERISLNDDLYWDLFKSTRLRSYPFYYKLKDGRDTSFNDTFLLYRDKSWKEQHIQVYENDACNKILLSRKLRTMNIARMQSRFKFYLFDNDPSLEDFPEMFVVYEYRGVADSGYFSFNYPNTQTVTSTTNPNLSIRIHKDTGIVHLENKGVFKLTRYNE